MLDEATLLKYMKRLGWECTQYGERTYRTAQSTREGNVTVYLRLSENWLIVSVVPFLSTRGKISLELSRWLLRQNRDMYQAKFAYDEDGDVVLSAELPTESIDEAEVQDALQGLVRYTIAHRNTLRIAAEPSRKEK